jgi:hypothetical protein
MPHVAAERSQMESQAQLHPPGLGGARLCEPQQGANSRVHRQVRSTLWLATLLRVTDPRSGPAAQPQANGFTAGSATLCKGASASASGATYL